MSFETVAQVKKEFTPRYSNTIKGDVTIIANNMLSDHSTNDFHGNEDNQDNNRVYVDIDGDNSTFNSSSANLSNPEPSVSCLEFTKAYLYWAASDKEAGGSSSNDESWNYNNIKLMLPGSSSYTTLTADEVLFRGRNEHFYNDPYICMKDITNDVLALADPYGKYQVGNVKATYGGLNPHGGGNFGVAGGWQIVFVYQSTELLSRNITLFDGYAHVHNNQTTDFDVNGFLAVPTGAVNADIVLGVIEGDRVLNGDSFQIRKPDNTWQKISTPLRDQNNFFNSRISIDGSNFTDRNPASTNTLGFDASIFELSNPGNTLIQNNQTSTTLRATSGQESYGLYLVGLSIEVYEPSLGALKFTTSPLNSTYDPGDIATLSMSIENSGNDNIRNLEISTILPPEVDFDSTQPLPPGVTYSFNVGTRELKFFVEDGYTDTNDPEYFIDFNVKVKEQCYFLETVCSANFTVQATATYTGEINTTPQNTNSSGTVDPCGFGNHDPSVITINQAAQVPWSSSANELDRTVACDDPSALSAAQGLEPLTVSCDFTLNKVAGVFVADPSCNAIGSYTNTWTFTDACGRVSETYTQVITIEDTSDPSFNEALPQDTVAAFDNIPSPEVLTAGDSCDSNPLVAFNESYIGDNNSTVYTIIRTWTASDCAGNSTEHTQKIFVTENGDPIGLAITDVIVNENSGTAAFSVVLTGEVSGGFTVDYESANGTANAPADFAALNPTSIFFNGNHGEVKTLNATINDDNIVEEDENFTVELSNLSTAEIGINDASGEGTILDNDAATIAIQDLTVNEDAGNIDVQVVLNGFTEEAFTVDYQTSNGSATAGTDYNSASGQLSFASNSSDGTIRTIGIAITDDNLIELTENFLVDLTNISATGNITISDSQASIDILDNDATPGTGISFDNTNVTVNEDAGTATFTVRLTGNVAGGFTLDYATADGAANQPGDYSSTSGTLTFVGNDGESFDINVPIIDDSLIENTEDFVVDLSNLSTSLIGINTTQASGNILDNDATPGTGISFDNTNVTVNEDAGTATFTVRLTGNVAGGFTLDYATADGAANQPGDYSSTSGTLTFVGNDGESFDINVPIIDDSLIENTEDFVVDLSNLSTSLIGINTTQASGNILDNDATPGTGISFDNTNVTVNEDAGTATFTVRLTGNVAGGFTLDYATADGTANQPGDYSSTSGTLTFVGNDGESFDINVPIIDDNLIENTEDFVVDLSNLSTSLIGINTTQASGNILDNDATPGTGVSFDNTNVTVNEDAGTATFTVRLTGNVAGGFTLDYATADGAANQPGDYTSTSGTLTFTGTDGESFDINVPIIDDSLIENTEDFVVDLSNLSTSLIGINTTQASGNILDNDATPGTGVSFDNTNVTVNEDAGTATFTVRLTGNVSGGFTLDYATADGAANQPGDYSSTSGTLTFVGNDGESFDINVPIIDDNLIENTEDFVVDLSNLSTSLIGINTTQASGNILDNDATPGTGISFDNTNVTVNEDAGTATFTVRLTGNVAGGFTLDYATADGAAGQPGDYSSTSGTLTFVGNDGESFDINVPIIDDSLIENTEDFVVDLSNLSTSLIGINTTQASGNILDNDATPGTGVSFDNTNVTVNEDAGTATFTVRLTGNVAGGFTLDYATADGLAGQPGDYTSTSGTLTFTGTDGESFDINVPIIDDSLIENTEDFVVDLSNLSTSLIGINTTQASGNILDNDATPGTGVSFDNTNVTVNEDAGTATFTVRLTGNVAGGFTLDYATADGAAGQPGDYTSTSGTLTFTGTDGESFDINVQIIDDSLIENTEDFVVDLSNLSTSLIGINTTQASGNILDNDATPGTGVSFDNTNVTVNEDAGTATFTVRLTGNVAGGFTLDYATADGTANQPGDYSSTSGTLTFVGNDGESFDINVPIIDDSLIENTEDFVVDLSNLSTSLIGINTTQASGNILDNDATPGTGVSFDNTNVTVNEDAGTATFTVRLTGNVAGGFTLDYATADGLAGQPGDYTSTSGTLTFTGTDGESFDINVPIIDDSLIENTEDFVVDLSNLSTSLIGINTTQASGNILDNDATPGTGISFDNTNVTVNEDAGTATFTVRLTGNVAGGFTLDYATADGAANQPGDYTSTSGTLTFTGTDGESFDINVPIIDDSLIENTEDFVVDLSNLSTSLIGINTTQASGNILDNDATPGTGISFDNTNATVNEDAGTATFTVRLTGNVQGGITVDYSSIDNLAAQPGDYTSTSGTLTFAGTDGESYDIVVPIIDDIIVETSETFFVDLSNVTPALVGINTSRATGNIIDNDSNDDFPPDSIVSCDAIPGVDMISLNANGCTYQEVFEETISGQDDGCATEYTITRKWTITDCVNNVRTHTQVITVEDIVAPVFVEELPQDMTVSCDTIPDAAALTAMDNCDTDVTVDFEETATNNRNCATGYVITRNWTATDCAGNSTSHSQLITIPATGPITSGNYDEEITIVCGEAIPEVPNLEFMGGCGDFQIVFNEETQTSSDTDDFMIIRTWEVTDVCGNMETFEQIIFVMQPAVETEFINICVEDDPIDLINYLPQDFDTDGSFEVTSGNLALAGGLLNPIDLEVGDYEVTYSSTEGTCKYYMDFTIRVNTDCVPCGREDIITSRTVTANGDGVNDYFEISGVEFCDFRFELMIFNRWGSKVYESKDYRNDWGGFSPNNSFGNSGMLPSGTYYYIIHVTNQDFEPINGYIYLGSN